MQKTSSGTVTVDVRIALDVICVHSYVGYTRFTRAANRLRDQGVSVRVDVLPFELAPGAGTEGQPLLPVLERAFGPQAVRQTLAYAGQLRSEGLELHYEHAVATGTFEAHRLIARAARQGRAEQMTERLFRAHFSDGLHIGDPGVLARLAREAGVDPEAVPVDDPTPEDARLRAELDRVRGLGVTGVPVFFVEDRPALTGSQSEEALFTAVREAAGTGAGL
ncbi:DsbA family oxidoreductase [Streptomyces sp. NPDC049954]|uniref:DsbA family oxidoreductase n=1 Tax=Streptomyces sp. NPDC049954 TaxID=3155779 RepID=UPI00343A83A4